MAIATVLPERRLRSFLAPHMVTTMFLYFSILFLSLDQDYPLGQVYTHPMGMANILCIVLLCVAAFLQRRDVFGDVLEVDGLVVRRTIRNWTLAMALILVFVLWPTTFGQFLGYSSWLMAVVLVKALSELCAVVLARLASLPPAMAPAGGGRVLVVLTALTGLAFWVVAATFTSPFCWSPRFGIFSKVLPAGHFLHLMLFPWTVILVENAGAVTRSVLLMSREGVWHNPAASAAHVGWATRGLALALTVTFFARVAGVYGIWSITGLVSALLALRTMLRLHRLYRARCSVAQSANLQQQQPPQKLGRCGTGCFRFGAARRRLVVSLARLFGGRGRALWGVPVPVVAVLVLNALAIVLTAEFFGVASCDLLLQLAMCTVVIVYLYMRLAACRRRRREAHAARRSRQALRNCDVCLCSFLPSDAASERRCPACVAASRIPVPVAAEPSPAPERLVDWACETCTLVNLAADAVCAACASPARRPVVQRNKVRAQWWSCAVCTFNNAPHAAACDLCNAARPAGAQPCGGADSPDGPAAAAAQQQQQQRQANPAPPPPEETPEDRFRRREEKLTRALLLVCLVAFAAFVFL